MRYVRLLLALLLAALAASVAAAAPASAATFTVTTTVDAEDSTPGDGVCQIASGPCSVRAAITEARENGNAIDDTIVLGPGDHALTLGELIVTGAGSVHLRGAGAAQTAIRQTGVGRVLRATAPGGPLRLTDLTVRGGRVPADAADSNGGGIYSIVGLALDGVVVYDNRILGAGPGGGLGGGIYATGDTVTIRRTTIARNQAPAQGGGASVQAQELLVESSLVDRNVVVAGSGGGLSLRAMGGAARAGRIVATTIAGNSAPGPAGQAGGLSGGGSDGTPFTVERSLLAGNSAGAEAGAWMLGPSTSATARNTTISGNSAGMAFGAGGIERQFGSGVLTLEHVTASGNSNVAGPRAFDAGGTSSVRLRATIVDGECATSPGAVDDLGHNLSSGTSCGLGAGAGANLGLEPLADNGGPSATHAIGATSPANNRAISGCPATDQRGAPRATTCDSGAFERGPAAPAAFDRPPALPDADGDGIEDLDDACPAAAGAAPGGCPAPQPPTPEPPPPCTPATCPGPPAPDPDPPAQPAAAKLAAGIGIRRASTARGRLTVAGTIAREATGSVALRLAGAGRIVRLRAPIRAGRFSASRRIARLPRRLRAGMLTVAYRGSSRVAGERVRLRAGTRAAKLRLGRGSLDRAGRLRLGGTVARHARGRVVVRIAPRTGTAFAPLSVRARIVAGRWRIDRRLPAAAASGVQVAVLYAGSAARRVWGERAVRALSAGG